MMAPRAGGAPKDNVVAISTKFTDAPPVDVRRREWDDCRHEHTILDETLRTVGCADCGEQRLDPFEVLVMLARTWRSWQREAETLRKLNGEYQTNRREAWERRRDRHLHAHPDHTAAFNRKQAAVGDPDRRYVGDSASEFACDTCWRIWIHFDRRWAPRRAPSPPPGPFVDA